MSMKTATELAVLLARCRHEGYDLTSGRSAHDIAADARRICALSRRVRQSTEWLLGREDNAAILQRRTKRIADARKLLTSYNITLEAHGLTFELGFPSGGTVWV